MILIIPTLIILGVGEILTAEWNYADNGRSWPAAFETCGKSRQSPIAIDDNILRIDKDLSKLKFSKYDKAIEKAQITNNGHSIEVSLKEKPDLAPSFTGADLKAYYWLAQFHFHWGSEGKVGSEHVLYNISYPLELHLVHVNPKYKTLGEAASQADGLSVIGILFELSFEDNPSLLPILSKIEAIKEGGTQPLLNEVKVGKLLPDNYNFYYRYDGSLTTPPCHESVSWIVLEKKNYLSTKQLEMFRKVLASGKPMSNNYRLTQSIASRTVYIPASNSNSIFGDVKIISTLAFASLILINSANLI